MQLTLVPEPDRLTIHVDEKRLDAAIATAFKDQVRNLIDGGGPMVTLDLGGVEFMDSSGLGAVIAIFKSMPEGGYGWYLIQDLTASLSYFREGRRNFLAFIVPVTEPLTQDSMMASED